MIRYIPRIAVVCLLGEALLILAAFVFATYLLIDVDPTDYLLNNFGIVSILLVALVFILALYFHDLYAEFHVRSRILLFQQLCMVTGVAFLAQGLISYLSANLRIPVRIMLMGSILAAGIIFVNRVLISSYTIHAIAKTQLLLVGASPVLGELDRYIDERPQTGLQIAGYVDDEPLQVRQPPRKSWGELSALRDIIQVVRPARIILGLTKPATPALTNELLEIRYSGYNIETAASAYERVCGRISIYDLDPARVACQVVLSGVPQRMFYLQLISRSAALAGIILTIPFMLLVAFGLLVTAGRPILERQRLAGLNGEGFDRYRFRLQQSSALARIVGKLRLDGLPQLLNILKGEMNFVGPQADRAEYVEAIERHIPYYRERYRVPPGMTGWAQIQWTEESSPEDTISRLEYDLYYVKNMSWSLDMLILLHTVKDML